MQIDKIRAIWLFFCMFLVSTASTALGQNEGLGDLDEAINKKIDAQSLQDLEGVAALVESALAKGLDDENTSFAKKMLGSISLQRGQAIVGRLKQGGISPGQFQQLRTEALGSLEKAVENDPALGDAHMLIASLSVLPGGNPKRAMEAANAAIENIEDSAKRSEAFVMRALLQEDVDKRIEDLNSAVVADPGNMKAIQARAVLQLQRGETDAGVSDLKMLLEKDPSNTGAAVAAAEALIQMDRAEDAVEILNGAIKAQPSAPLYLLRSELRRVEGKDDEAMADLDRALAMEANNPAALLLRAENRLRKDDVDGARADVDSAMALQPGNGRGVFLRSIIAAQQQRYADAINDMKILVRNQPENTIWALQLGNYYQLDDRPRKAIEVASEILKRESDQWQALRLRGDAYLSINEHDKAIADYEAALQIPVATEEELETNPSAMSAQSRSGLANNLAWVLATSPKDELRNGEKALKYGTEAAELTEFKEPHILSTLAAAYAESGDFNKAIEWAEKAVNLGKDQGHEQLEQLEKELDSYRENKPWREEQNVEENKIPILSPEEVIDT